MPSTAFRSGHPVVLGFDLGFLARGSRRLRSLACIIGLAAIGMALTACGSSSTSTTVSNPPKGSYTVTVTGTDSSTSTITNTTTFNFTIN